MIKYDELFKKLHWKLAIEIKYVSCLIAKNLEIILGDYFLKTLCPLNDNHFWRRSFLIGSITLVSTQFVYYRYYSYQNQKILTKQYNLHLAIYCWKDRASATSTIFLVL